MFGYVGEGKRGIKYSLDISVGFPRMKVNYKDDFCGSQCFIYFFIMWTLQIKLTKEHWTMTTAPSVRVTIPSMVTVTWSYFIIIHQFEDIIIIFLKITTAS